MNIHTEDALNRDWHTISTKDVFTVTIKCELCNFNTRYITYKKNLHSQSIKQEQTNV